jgi:hypothetical protein
MYTIELLEDMTIPSGTIMTKYFSQLSWTYFKDKDENILIIMGYDSNDWSKVKVTQPGQLQTITAQQAIAACGRIMQAR